MKIFKFFYFLFFTTSLLLANPLSLTEKEKEWIKKNPTIKLAYLGEWEDSIKIETPYVKLLSKYSGINIKMIPFYTWEQAYKEALNGKKVQGIFHLSKNSSREKLFDYLPSYTFRPFYLLTNKDNHNIKSFKDLENQSIFTMKSGMENNFIKELPYNIKTIPLDDELSIIKKLGKNEGKAQAGIIYYVSNLEEMLKNNGAKWVKKIYIHYGEVHLGLTKNNGLLYSILQKAHDAIPPNELKKIHNYSTSNSIKFSKKERDYLYQKEKITLCVTPKWMPFSYITKTNKVKGMVSDFIETLSLGLNKNLAILYVKNWSDIIQKAKQHQCDIVTLIEKTDEREMYLNFTKPVIQSSYIIVSNSDGGFFVDNFSDIKDKKFAAIKDSNTLFTMKKKYPDIKIYPVLDTHEGLAQAKKGKVYGFIDASIPITYHLDKAEYINLKIVNKLPLEHELSFGVNKNDEILFGMVNKVIESMSAEELTRIRTKWVTLEKEKVPDYSLVWKVVLSAFFILILILLWIKKISRTNKLLKIAQQEIEEKNKELERLAKTDKLTGIGNRVHTDDFIVNELKKDIASRTAFSICLLDIDYFKQVNDTYGHQTGDTVLQELSLLIQRYTRKMDCIGRWGGEEFIIISPNTDQDEAFSMAEHLRQEVQKFNFTKVGSTTISIGVTTCKQDDTTQTLIKRVDEALYEAKKNGRNRVISR